MEILWERRALLDLGQVEAYIAQDNPRAAVEISAAVRRSVSHLELMPHMGRVGRIGDTRELVVAGTPYIVVYRVRADAVEVLAIMHGTRAWPERF